MQLRVDAAPRSIVEPANERDALLSQVAHELRGALNSISGWVQLLQSGRLDAARWQRAFEAIARGIQAQTTLIDEMQSVSRALHNRLQMMHNIVDPASALHRAVETVRSRATVKSIVISVDIDHDVRVSGDAECLTQLFARLLDAAERRTPEHGSIDVRLCAWENDACVVVASDGLQNGVEPFPSATDGRSQTQRGLAAGLALARRIAELHDGRIDDYSDDPGSGARFVVTLPLARADETRRSANRSFQGAGTETSHLNVVAIRRE